MIFRFLGTQAVVAGVAELKTLGQSVELEPDFANELIAGGLALLPDEEFAELGFSAEELKRYGDAFARAAAPAEFGAKLRAGWVRVAEIRAELEGGN